MRRGTRATMPKKAWRPAGGGDPWSRPGRWRFILPRPACAGGRQIPWPGPRQSQLPGECLLAPGI